ncbi:MAG: hypothetical protein COU68_04385 [Candidatus Pacebacteria bacterium CG10_big_fil_rev_8_21_14_0_10_45_6]|nr:MAG: hypothetical protein COU68_04385 [Candidatus Pacebacteria bacterium CG10_big_fil_rev_8_21_14_0_10_45_6]
MKLLRLLLKPISSVAGFTMIELLIVISILGILAVAVLSAINPIEQINRGKDTGSQSDAEQLISAIDRYFAFNGTYPWQGTAAGASALNDYMSSTNASAGVPVVVSAGLVGGGAGAPAVLAELEAKDELKSSFITRIDSAVNSLYIYHLGAGTGNSTYVCFRSQSKAFKEKADARCVDAAGSGYPSDISTEAKAFICAGFGDAAIKPYSCLP